MNAAQKKKISNLILERLRTAGVVTCSSVLHRTQTIPNSILAKTLETLASDGLEAVVRQRRRQGERYYSRSRKYPRLGEARFKYDPVPKAQGKIYMYLLTSCWYGDPNQQSSWKQVWAALDKETAMKALVLEYLPDLIQMQPTPQGNQI